jgi:ABC-2 type transport system ATP-binding protein
MDAVVLERVTKSFNSTRAVEALSLRVPVGSIYGFLGPNGAGKTTTIRMIMDIIAPDSGRLEVLGAPSAGQGKARVGYMPEERGLYARMTVGRVLAYIGSLKGVGDRELGRRVPDWLARVGLADCGNKKVQELSRGMQQRLQFAAAAIHDPELLILDEPFSGLDPVNLDELKQILLDMRQAGKTIIFSTHQMDEAQRLCDFILLINKGRAVVDGPLEDIRNRRGSNTVVVEVEGDAGFIAALPMVAGVTAVDRRLEITLTPGGDSQDLLACLVGKVRVLAFERKVPSLHDVFVQLVRSGDA